MGSICNDEQACFGVMSGHDQKTLRLSEGVNESGVAEQTVQAAPIKAQSTAVARATARICNAEWGCLGGMSGHGGFVHTFSDSGLRPGGAGGLACCLGAARVR